MWMCSSVHISPFCSFPADSLRFWLSTVLQVLDEMLYISFSPIDFDRFWDTVRRTVAPLFKYTPDHKFILRLLDPFCPNPEPVV